MIMNSRHVNSLFPINNQIWVLSFILNLWCWFYIICEVLLCMTKTTPIGMWNTSLKADMLPSFWADMVKFWSNSSCLPFLFLKEVRNNQRLQQSEQSQLGLSSTISNEVGATAMKKSVCPNLWAEPKNTQQGFWRYTKGCSYSHNGIFLKSIFSL